MNELEYFENATEEEKLAEIWKVSHLETVNSVSKRELHAMLKWLAEYALEEI